MCLVLRQIRKIKIDKCNVINGQIDKQIVAVKQTLAGIKITDIQIARRQIIKQTNSSTDDERNKERS